MRPISRFQTTSLQPFTRPGHDLRLLGFEILQQAAAKLFCPAMLLRKPSYSRGYGARAPAYPGTLSADPSPAFDHPRPPAIFLLAGQNFCSNPPVEEDEFLVHSDRGAKLGRPNLVLQTWQEVLIALRTKNESVIAVLDLIELVTCKAPSSLRSPEGAISSLPPLPWEPSQPI